jgi:hypothetical protein
LNSIEFNWDVPPPARCLPSGTAAAAEEDGKKDSNDRGQLGPVDNTRKTAPLLNPIAWLGAFTIAKEFQEENGHSNIKVAEDSHVYSWLQYQRRCLRPERRCTRESKFRIAKLNTIGYDWGDFPPAHCAPSDTSAAAAAELSKGGRKQ